MMDILLIAAVALLACCVVLLLLVLKKVRRSGQGDWAPRLDALEKSQERTVRDEAEKTRERVERVVRDELGRNREELLSAASRQRQELTVAFTQFSDSVAQRLTEVTGVQKGQFEAFAAQLGTFAADSGERLKEIRGESLMSARQLRDGVEAALVRNTAAMDTHFGNLTRTQQERLETMAAQLGKLADTNETKLEAVRTESAAGARQLRDDVMTALNRNATTMDQRITTLVETNEKKLEALRQTVEGKLQSIQTDNAARLEQMRATVEEKLQTTLESRLGESFKLVSAQLEQVHKGLGEMQTLAGGVGDLKKVLTNVKTRGTWGEIQLGALLEQILIPEQYGQNVATRKNSNERVEFAVRLPGREDDGKPLWLPIDAKCPVEDYQRLLEAQDRGDAAAAGESAQRLEIRIKSCARDIRDKYIHPPATTDFALMYLPTEGLYAEAIRRPGLVEFLQRECRVNLCGPTTLAVTLNALQMGFRSLAIQKRSSEVWKVLGAVKSGFGKFGEVLEKVQKKLGEASDTIDDASKRTQIIASRLRAVQELPAEEARTLLLEVDGAGDAAEAEAS